MVARDAAAQNPVPINPLVLKDDQEKTIFDYGVGKIHWLDVLSSELRFDLQYFICKARHKRRIRRNKSSIFNNDLPNTEENQLIYEIFMKTANPANITFSAQKLPSSAVWLKDTEMTSGILLEPETRNPIEYVFGGVYMRNALELSFATASQFRCVNKCKNFNIKKCELNLFLIYHKK